MTDEQWYYNVDDGTVAQGKQADWTNRLGPYPDKATAEQAIQIIKKRNEQADLQDKKWDN